MPYALNTNKGTTIVNESIGILESGIAIIIPDDVTHIAKSLRGVVVFDKVAGIDESKLMVGVYGKSKEVNESIEEDLTYQDFVKKYGELKLASQKWKEHQENKGKKK